MRQEGMRLVALGILTCAGCQLPDSRQDLAAWIVGGDETVFGDTSPQPENELYSANRGSVRLRGAIGETLAIQLALRSDRWAAGAYDVRISDLRGEGDAISAERDVSICRVHEVRVDGFPSWYPGHTGRAAQPIAMPDVLVPWDAARGGGPMVLDASRSQAAWIDIRIPPTVAPGRYSGRIEVIARGAGRSVFESRIELDVLPVALHGRRSLPVLCRIDPRDLLVTHLRWPKSTAEEVLLLPDVPSHFAAVGLVQNTVSMFQRHRCTPILWAQFPRFRVVGDRRVEVEWAAYDRLVEPWLDGSAFEDRVPVSRWVIPASLKHPDASRYGGFESPRYARVLAAYLDECERHFSERGWLDRAVLRVCPPAKLSSDAVRRVERLCGIVQQSETDVPIVAHLPVRSLRGLGWHGAPPIDLPKVDVWAPPGMWYEPAELNRAHTLGDEVWMMPDHPPYSGALTVATLATDATSLPWQAYRYDTRALWVENAAGIGPSVPANAEGPWVSAGLVYAGEPFGLRDRPVASIRLKRIRRGLQDYELLRLLEENGKSLLAGRLARQVIRWGGTDAAIENLLSTKPAGWPRRPEALRLARTLMRQELAGEFENDPALRQQQLESLSQWGLMMSRADRVSVRVDGVRLRFENQAMQAEVSAHVTNASDRALHGKWRLPASPGGWQQNDATPVSVSPGADRTTKIGLSLPGLTYNARGVYPFAIEFDTDAMGAFRVPARLAVAACPQLEQPPAVDGVLGDWPLASNNAAGDFRLIRPLSQTADADQPTNETAAYFGWSDSHLYIAIRCGLQPGEQPVWRADNVVPIEGNVPWGQDVVEILIDPTGDGAGDASRLYCIQVKPSGLLVSRRGCRTEPPMSAWEPWLSGARVAVKVEPTVWVVELAVPLEAFPSFGRRNPIWGLNITRLDARRGEYASWSGARGHAYNPASVGNLIMLWR